MPAFALWSNQSKVINSLYLLGSSVTTDGNAVEEIT